MQPPIAPLVRRRRLLTRWPATFLLTKLKTWCLRLARVLSPLLRLRFCCSCLSICRAVMGLSSDPFVVIRWTVLIRLPLWTLPSIQLDVLVTTVLNNVLLLVHDASTR